MFQQIATWNRPIMKLFCRFLFVFLRRGEALRLFATNGALPNVVSSVIVPHRTQYSSACRALAMELTGRRQRSWGSWRKHGGRASDQRKKPRWVAASERSRRAARDIDGKTERSKWAGAHESTWAANEFQLLRPLPRVLLLEKTQTKKEQ